MNKYRVDRNNKRHVPCGMNSIIYIGNNLIEAKRRYQQTLTGFDWWSKVDNNYGVILSEWNGTDYKILDCKGNI